jgi:hypothetical protein
MSDESMLSGSMNLQARRTTSSCFGRRPEMAEPCIESVPCIAGLSKKRFRLGEQTCGLGPVVEQREAVSLCEKWLGISGTMACGREDKQDNAD